MFNRVNHVLSSQFWDRKEINSIKKVINSGQFTMSKNVNLFEKKFAKYFNTKYAIMFNSGSSANFATFFSFMFHSKINLKAKDEVIVPALAWSTTYSPFYYIKAKLVLVDVDKKTFNLNIKQVIKSISNKTKLIVAVNLLGNPAELIQLKKICNEKNIALFEDNCESLGAKLNNKYTGTFGLASSTSFFYSHHMSTIEGGMVITNNKELSNLLKQIRAHGWTRDTTKIINKKKEYNFVIPGMNLRPTEINAAIGIEQLKKLKKIVSLKRKNYLAYYKIFSKSQYFDIIHENGNNSSFVLPFILKNKYKSYLNKLRKLLRKNNIEYRLVAGGSFTKHPYYKYFDLKKINKLDNSNYIHNYGFVIGNHPELMIEKIKKISKIMDSIFIK